ncbi:hypothetical protein H5410_026637 [Solanum commersonii]|uniref:Uncharacterized protein n=1 Tax=Solanum commersonii TaxID=4109 RepID=A0A9J5YX39_SOLCO|nr:hypothetical protein H5410_026637 [Solanum commersonii]
MPLIMPWWFRTRNKSIDQHFGETISDDGVENICYFWRIDESMQLFSTTTSDIDSPNAHQLTLSLVRKSPRNDLRLHDMRTLARLMGRFTKEEERVIYLLLHNAKE